MRDDRPDDLCVHCGHGIDRHRGHSYKLFDDVGRWYWCLECSYWVPNSKAFARHRFQYKWALIKRHEARW